VKGSQLGSLASALLAITMIAAMLLLIFGARLAMRPDDRQRGLLMIGCGIIFIGNVLIWTI
jgi:hypothetical protein